MSRYTDTKEELLRHIQAELMRMNHLKYYELLKKYNEKGKLDEAWNGAI